MRGVRLYKFLKKELGPSPLMSYRIQIYERQDSRKDPCKYENYQYGEEGNLETQIDKSFEEE
jgi:hypothetical protein